MQQIIAYRIMYTHTCADCLRGVKAAKGGVQLPAGSVWPALQRPQGLLRQLWPPFVEVMFCVRRAYFVLNLTPYVAFRIMRPHTKDNTPK